MALETKKSAYIGDRDATPTIPVSASVAGGIVKSSHGFVTVSVSASTGSLYPLISVPSNSRVISLRLDSAAVSNLNAQINVGVYWPTLLPAVAPVGAVASAAISASFFAAAQSVSAAQTALNILNQSTNNPTNLQEMELWQAVGLAQDPSCYLDITATIVTAAAVAGGLLGMNCDFIF